MNADATSLPNATQAQDRSADREQVVAMLRRLRVRDRSRSRGFACFLDEQPTALVPRRARPLPADAALIVNPGLRCQFDAEPPAELLAAGLPLDGLMPAGPIAWVHQPASGFWLPYWARGRWSEVLAALRPGEPAPGGLDAVMRATLAEAQILVQPDHAEAERAHWETVFAAAAAAYRGGGHAVLRDLLHPLQTGALRQYYRTLLAEENVPLGDPRVASRYRIHDESVASFLHRQLAGPLEHIVGEPMRPSFSYFASYLPGSTLPPHTDREQCEVTISLQVDYEPAPDGATGWLLHVEDPRDPRGFASVDLGLGDCVCYRGRVLTHYRDALPAGHVSTSIFFCYVRTDFQGKLS